MKISEFTKSLFTAGLMSLGISTFADTALQVGATGEGFDTGVSVAEDCTIEFWGKVNTLSGNTADRYMGITTDGGGNNELGFFVRGDGSVQFHTWGDFNNPAGNNAISAANVVTAGQWHHFAIVHYGKDGSSDGNAKKVYIDGVLAVESNPNFDKPWGQVRVGNVWNIQGEIDELRIWDDARSLAEIKSNIYANSSLISPENLNAWYKFSTGSGGTFTDSSDNSNDITTGNTYTWPTRSVTNPADVEIDGYEALSDYKAWIGSSIQEVTDALPTAVKMDGFEALAPIASWNNDDNYDADTTGSYTFTGTIGTLPIPYVDAVSPVTTVSLEVVVSKATLKHRYSFTTDASDSVGSANLTLTGNATVSGNKLTLTGGKADATGASLTELATTIKVSTPITIEAWYTLSEFKNWSKLYTIGDSASNHILLTPRTGVAGNRCRPAILTASGSKIFDDSVATALNTQVYVAVTYDPVNDEMTFHRAFDGDLDITTQSGDMGGALLTELTISKFSLAAANFWGDPNMLGSIDEFRIWEGGISNATALNHFTEGPDDDTVTPAIGLDVEQIGDELTWTVEDEINVEKYVITYTVNGKTKTETVFYKEANNGSYTLALEEGAIVVDFETVDNSGYSESYPVENGNITSKRYNLEEGWNLIAIISDDADLETLKDETVGVLWGWNGASYEVIETAKATDAVWVYSSVAKEVSVTGTKSDAKIKLNLGWNMVGPVENDYIPAEADTVYSWSEVYDKITGEEKVLIGGKGYWIFSL